VTRPYIHWFAPTLDCWIVGDGATGEALRHRNEIITYDSEPELLDDYPGSRQVELGETL
jgi:hypothetical protein